LRQTPANSSDHIEVLGYLLVNDWIKYYGFRFSVDGKHKRPPRLFHALHQVGRIAFERCERVDVLGYIDHSPMLRIMRIEFKLKKQSPLSGSQGGQSGSERVRPEKN
jgi:hypothetical protein